MEIPVEFLRECFGYDAETGVIMWRSRPRAHFKDDRAQARFEAAFSGKPAGRISVKGYLTIGLSYEGKVHTLRANRLIWAMVTGAWPRQLIDHRNRVKSDNRVTNLREATKAQNAWNSVRPAGKLPRGVRKFKDCSKFFSLINVNMKSLYLGSFETPEAAHAAYVEAKKQHHGEFAAE